MNEKIRTVLHRVVERFRSGDIPEAISLSMFPIPNIPAARWSLLNRTIMCLEGTQDARGFRQWQKAGRKVKKGARAFFILAPVVRKVKDEETEEERQVLAGFVPLAVFRAEDTEGAPLGHAQRALPDLPLLERAHEWGISVRVIPGNYRYYGRYSQDRNEILLATEEEVVFFHELSHAAHKKSTGVLKNGQDWRQEVVAELSATVLCSLVGRDGSRHLGHSYRYIEEYAGKAGLNAYQGCLKVLTEVEKVLELILGQDRSCVEDDNVLTEN